MQRRTIQRSFWKSKELFYFIDGTQPKSVCDIHVSVSVNSSNNKLANKNTPSRLIEDKVFINKPNANPNADDYPFVVPTREDDTKAEEYIKLSEIGLRADMDLYDAIVILNNRGIKYKIHGASVASNISSGQYTLVSFTEKIKNSETVKLNVKVTTNTPDENIGNNGNNHNRDTSTSDTDAEAHRTSISDIINGLFNH